MMPEVEKIEEEFINNSLPEVDDNAETDNTIAPVRYDITSYGAD
jgi:hypothetical protein